MEMSLDENEVLNRIYDLLYCLGTSPNYVGYFYIAYAVFLALEDSKRLLSVTKLLYPSVAQYCQTNWKAVERDIRTVVSVIWKTNPSLLSEYAGFPLTDKPISSRFLSILTAYYLRIYAQDFP